MGIFKLFELNIGNIYLLFYNVIYMSGRPDCLDINKKINQELTLGKLAKIIYDNYDNLQELLPKLNIMCFYLMQPWSRLKGFIPSESYTPINSSMIVNTGETIRYTVISKGSEKLLDKYNGIFSYLLTFMYFFVEYIKKNKGKYLDLSFNTFIPDPDCINYIKEFLPLHILGNQQLEYSIWWYHPLKLINNNIVDHINTGNTEFPHFFISSMIKNNINIQNAYKIRAIEYAKKTPNTRAVKIHFILSKDNPAIFVDSGERDYILSPFIKEQHFTIEEVDYSDEEDKVDCNDRDNHNYRDRDRCDNEQRRDPRRDDGGGRTRKKKYKIKKTKKQKTKKLKINKKQKIKKQKTKKIKKIKTKNNKKKY
jgi:hypothetical protein